MSQALAQMPITICVMKNGAQHSCRAEETSLEPKGNNKSECWTLINNRTHDEDAHHDSARLDEKEGERGRESKMIHCKLIKPASFIIIFTTVCATHTQVSSPLCAPLPVCLLFCLSTRRYSPDVCRQSLAHRTRPSCRSRRRWWFC